MPLKSGTFKTGHFCTHFWVQKMTTLLFKRYARLNSSVSLLLRKVTQNDALLHHFGDKVVCNFYLAKFFAPFGEIFRRFDEKKNRLRFYRLFAHPNRDHEAPQSFHLKRLTRRAKPRKTDPASREGWLLPRGVSPF